MVIAAVTFFLGFFTGAGFAIYKTGSSPGAVSTASAGIDTAGKAKTLEVEVARNPSNTAAWIQLGNVYFDTGNHARAIAAYEKALELSPANANVLTDIWASCTVAAASRTKPSKNSTRPWWLIPDTKWRG